MTHRGHTIGRTGNTMVTVRVADEADAPALARLAALDSTSIPAGSTLLAEIDGQVAAALPLGRGPGVADPFRHTSAALELLELRAAQIRGQGQGATSPGSYGQRLRALLRARRALQLR